MKDARYYLMNTFRTLDDRARTNNHVEGWHSGLQRSLDGIPADKPHEFLLKLKENYEDTQADVASWRSGFADPPQMSKQQKEKNARLKKIVQRYRRDKMLEYLQNLAPSMKR